MASKSIHISVAISRPVKNAADRLSNFYHWTLHIHNPKHDIHVQYEVTGEANKLSLSTLHSAPCSKTLIKEIFLAEIEASANTIDDIARSVKIENDIYTWDCQDYVIAVIDALEEAGLIDESVQDYQVRKRKIIEMRGSIEDTQALVKQYNPGAAPNMEADDHSSEDEEEADSAPRNVRSEEYVVDSNGEED